MSYPQEIKNYINLQCLLTEALKTIRILFLTNWKNLNGTDWLENKQSAIDYFKNGEGKKAYSTMHNDQKKHADLGDTSKWDMSLFFLIFSNSKLVDKSSLKIIQKIKDVRNQMAHNVNMSMSNEMYEKNWKQIEECLVKLGKEKQEIENFKLKLNKNETSESNNESKAFKEKANEYFKQNDFDKSIEYYSKAIEIKNLSNDEKSTLYCNRSLAYLKKFEKNKRNDREYLFKALVDAEQANSYNPKWFKTYARLAQVYSELSEFEKSIEYYSKALILDPTNEEIKNSLAYCKLSNYEQNRLSHFDKSYQPKSTEERLDEYFIKAKDRFGQIDKEIMSESVEFAKKFLLEKDKSLKDVWLAHEYRDGSEKCEQNFELAAKYYSKAAENNNAEALYNLALLTMKGLGVKRDYKLAISLLKNAANQPHFIKIASFDAPNVGVLESEHKLGMMYQTGEYVSKNIALAIEYYQSAVDHGSSRSANNLGILYMNGDGVSTDLDRAEKLFLFCHKKGCNDSITNLVELYLRKNDPEQALLWHKRDLVANSLFAMNRNDLIMKKINELKDLRKKIGIPENKNFDEFFKENIPKLDIRKFQNIQKKFYPHTGKQTHFDPEIMLEYSQKGSVIAKKMFDAYTEFYEGLFEFMISKDSEDFNIEKVLDKMSKGYQIESLVCKVTIDINEELTVALEKIISKNLTNNLDLNARICFACLKMSDFEQNICFLNESIMKYPNCILMYRLRGSMYCFLEDYENGIRNFDHVILKDDKNFDAFYDRAKASKCLEKFSSAIKDYENFINNSPIENRFIPEAYYSIGLCKALTMKNKFSKILKEYYQKGKEAEKFQLPFFLPYESNAKKYYLMMENFLQISVNDSTHNEGKNLIKDEYKIELIKKHRTTFYEAKDLATVKSTIKPPKTQKMPYSLAGLKEIKLNQIDFTKDEILNGYLLTVRIFDVPIFPFTSVFFIVDDENTFEKLSVYNLGNDFAQIKEDFKIGTWISIINPYIRQAADGDPMIRVDDPKSIFFTGRLSEKMCRYCGKENSKYNCAKCLKAFYCDKECQVNDWKELNHKLVCFK